MMFRIPALILAATLAVPAVGLAGPQVRVGVTIGQPHRVYDRGHHDYHVWDSQENHEYRQYLVERHRGYVAYSRQRRVQQSAYWQWRHERLERH